MSDTETQFTNIIDIIYTKNDDKVFGNQFQEAAIMSKIFNNTTQNLGNFYLLEDKRGDPLQNHIKFYDRHMQRDNTVITVSSINVTVMDLDISPMLTQDTIKYLFFLDLLSEIYYNYQKTSSTITVKCRYFIDEGNWKLYTRSDFYKVEIEFTLPTKKTRTAIYNIKDIIVDGPTLQNKQRMLIDIKNMFELYSTEIIRHIGYLGKKDIQKGSQDYLENIQGFYKFCRLKMLYYAIKSIPDTRSRDIAMFIDTQLIYLFLNLKNDIAMKNPGYQNITATTKLLATKKKLQAINDETIKSKEMIRRNEMQSNKIKGSYNRQLLYVCFALALIFILTTFFIISETRASQISFIIILITLCVYVTMYYILYMTNVSSTEYFESYGFDKIFQFPLEETSDRTKNEYDYGNSRLNKRIRIFGSSKYLRNDFWMAFDRKTSTFWESKSDSYNEGSAKYTYRTDYIGEFLQIDLAEKVILKYFTISFSENIKAPQNFRLYGSNKDDTVANLGHIDINDPTWKPLIDVKNVKYPTVAKRRFDLTQTQFDQYLYPQQIAAGRNFSIFIDNETEGRAFGLNSQGQLGVGNNDKQFYPQLVLLQASRSLKNIIQVSAGGFHTLFLTNEGFAYSCGNNQWGQLGDSTTTTRYYPVDVRSSTNSKLTNIVQVCAGHTHSMFLKVNKTVIGCGRNKNGQLGNGTTLDNSLPTSAVIDKDTGNQLSNIIQIAAGVYSFSTFFLKSNGIVYKCGVYADPATEAIDNYSKAERVSNSDDVTVKISAAGGFCLGVTDTNHVWGIGQNKFNQLGDKDYIDGSIFTSPKYVHINTNDVKTILTDIIDVAAGTSHSIFLKANGIVMVCGKNNFGQLGLGNTTNIIYPTVVPELSNVFQIAAGDNHSMFLCSSGSSGSTILKTCGFNADGQIGAVAKPSGLISSTEECYSCLNPVNTAKFSTFLTKSPIIVTTSAGAEMQGPIVINKNNVTSTYINNYENTIYTNNINNEYRHYALIINKLSGNVPTANRAQISEWELFGTYDNQTSYLNTEYNKLFTNKTKEYVDKKEEYEIQKRGTEKALSDAIIIENARYTQWQALVKELEKPEYQVEGLVIPIDMDIGFFQRELPKLRKKIDTTLLEKTALEVMIASSNTESTRLGDLSKALDIQNVQLNIDISTLSGQYASFQSYKTVIDSLQETIEKVGLENNSLLSEQQKSVIQSRIDETNAAVRLGAAQVDRTTSQILLRQKQNSVFEKANDLANIKLEADRETTLLQNEITTRQSILKNITLVTAADADIQSEEIKRLEAEKQLVAARRIAEGVQVMADAQMAIAEDAKKTSDELQGILLQKTEDVRKLRNQTDNLLNDLEKLDDQIARIEGDTSAYVDRIEKDTRLLEARRSRDKKWYEYQISKLQTTYFEVDQSVREKISDYERSMSEDQEVIDQLIGNIKIKSEEIAEIVIERQKYKYIAKVVEVDASVVTIQTKILYNINNTATVIANSIVLTGMDNEYRQIEGQRENVKILETKSDNSVEINKRDDKIIFATNKLLLNVMLAAVILIIIYQNYTSMYVLIFMIIIFAILISFYFIEVLQIVRTFGSKYYWQTGLPKEFTDDKK